MRFKKSTRNREEEPHGAGNIEVNGVRFRSGYNCPKCGFVCERTDSLCFDDVAGPSGAMVEALVHTVCPNSDGYDRVPRGDGTIEPAEPLPRRHLAQMALGKKDDSAGETLDDAVEALHRGKELVEAERARLTLSWRRSLTMTIPFAGALYESHESFDLNNRAAYVFSDNEDAVAVLKIGRHIQAAQGVMNVIFDAMLLIGTYELTSSAGILAGAACAVAVTAGKTALNMFMDKHIDPTSLAYRRFKQYLDEKFGKETLDAAIAAYDAEHPRVTEPTREERVEKLREYAEPRERFSLRRAAELLYKTLLPGSGFIEYFKHRRVLRETLELGCASLSPEDAQEYTSLVLSEAKGGQFITGCFDAYSLAALAVGLASADPVVSVAAAVLYSVKAAFLLEVDANVRWAILPALPE